MRLPALLLFLLLAGCARDQLPDYAASAGQALPATWYDAVVVARDGTRLAATVFQPALNPGESAPLIVHTHGWGGWRVTGPEGFYGQNMMSGRAALKAWKAGYWVVSYDQRGWGGSDGRIEMMDPRYEVSDASAVIDWAAAHLPRLRMDGPGDPRVGMLGESYGGAVQLLAAAEDPRIDAIVPIATWYDLSDALAPGGQLKIGWGGVLVSLGVATGYDLGKFVQADYLRTASGRMSPPVQAELAAHSLARYCAEGRRPHADALLIQGLRDTLFPLDQGLRIRQCLRQGDADVRLLGMQGGHILPPPLQAWSGLPPFNNEPVIHCGERAINLYQGILAWYEEKLRQRPGAAASVPSLCISLDLDQGLALDDLPPPGPTVALPPTRVRPASSGLLQPRRFIALHKVAEPSALLGSAEVRLARPLGSGDQALLFASLAVRGADGRTRVLDEQVKPLLNQGATQLNAVSASLAPGDEIGLLVSGFSGQYLFNSSWSLRALDLEGEVRLPALLPLQPRLAAGR
ncbi:CocE/NonD family hydrolase [Pseudomonas citronellolis]|uniref:CocE/NonD family hydrolase n=1 Tax=Pseudomonas citronellolis TaxID=53408 RepID=UPI0023E3D4FA|nr:CocE/NonD family hydrolase [Pseudomonas citronellolis]MDF3936205.1 CocE/NonD family hydrolase [Pseudomonas citronellolis]